MEDKLNHLSNTKSSDFKETKYCCGNTPEKKEIIKKYIKELNLDYNNLSNDKSITPNQVIIKEVPNNPYCSSITGKYVFDLTQFSNFNVYFWKSTDNIGLNNAIASEINYYSTFAVNYTNNSKIQVKKSLDIFTKFLGKTSTVVNDYSSCDIVCVLLDNMSKENRITLGLCYGPEFIKTEPTFVNNKIVYVINNSVLNENNIQEGGNMYLTLIHEWGHGFGFGHPHDEGFGSTIMPGVLESEPYSYKSIGGYIQNNIFNTVMSYNDTDFFLPPYQDMINNKYGYPETIMPLDSLALRWMYNVQEIPVPYINTYGVQVINEGVSDIYHSRMIVGKNQTIEFGPNCLDIEFYFSNQYFTFNNLNYLRYDYIRNLENTMSFYTKDIDSTISVLNLKNEWAYIFIENRALVVDLTINLISESEFQTLYLYILDADVKYTITGNIVVRHKKNRRTITINNPNSRSVYIYFNESNITRNVNNLTVENIKTDNTNDNKTKKYINKKNIITKSINDFKSISEDKIIIKDLPPNPYCSSITGIYAFDLTNISNFKVYFWKSTDNKNLNPMIEYFLDDPTPISAINWTNYQIDQCKKALDIFTSFTGITSTIVNNYDDSDFVCVLAPFTDFNGYCLGPYSILELPDDVDNKMLYFMSSLNMNTLNIQEGGFIYNLMIREWGRGFGLDYPDDIEFGSNIMPAIAFNQSERYPSIASYIQNNSFNTVMTRNDKQFFLPFDINLSTNLTGYPETLMPLDALALRWLYNIIEIPQSYINNFGVKIINPESNKNQSRMIVGKNQTITFGSNNDAVNFYLTNQWFTYYNLQPIKLEYNRPIKKQWSFYPRDLDSTISTINLNNTGKAFIFLENNALAINLTVNITNNSRQVLNFYCMDCKKNYLINGNVYCNRTTNKTFTINNTVGATVNVYFDK
jgi:hypothetical protein